MELSKTTRRQWLTSTTALGSGVLLSQSTASAKTPTEKKSPFGYCFNTSTIRAQNLNIEQKIDIAAKAGFHAVEPWIREIEEYQNRAKLKDLAKRLKDAGLTVESAIGFAQWIVDDDDKRNKALEQAKRDMDLIAQLGGTRIAAPPTGATRQKNLDLKKAAERYRALLELGEKMGVIPQLEVWGFSTTFSKLSEVAYVAIECGHPKACILPDIYHLYKGGNDFSGLKLLSGKAIQVFHVNDYPADPSREKIGDADRVHVGDGVAPVKQILRDLADNGFQGYLSLELFNRTYWKQDPLQVARTGLEKIKSAVKAAMESNTDG